MWATIWEREAWPLNKRGLVVPSFLRIFMFSNLLIFIIDSRTFINADCDFCQGISPPIGTLPQPAVSFEAIVY